MDDPKQAKRSERLERWTTADVEPPGSGHVTELLMVGVCPRPLQEDVYHVLVRVSANTASSSRHILTMIEVTVPASTFYRWIAKHI